MQGLAPPPPPTMPARRARLGRVAWHAIGLLAAALVAWLILRGYRQADLLLDIGNLRLC